MKAFDFQVYCQSGTNEEYPDESKFRWSVKHNGALNGDEIATIDEISNCSPGKIKAVKPDVAIYKHCCLNNYVLNCAHKWWQILFCATT